MYFEVVDESALGGTGGLGGEIHLGGFVWVPGNPHCVGSENITSHHPSGDCVVFVGCPLGNRSLGEIRDLSDDPVHPKHSHTHTHIHAVTQVLRNCLHLKPSP